MSKQISAVEWLFEQYVNKSIITIEAVEQAKEMEKEQIIKHSLELAKILISNPYETSGKMPTELIDSYINETFKSK
jgi:hypothetical protein